MHELSISSAIVDTAVRHADGRPGDARSTLRVGALRQVVPESLDFYFEIVGARHASARARALELELVGALDALRGLRPRVGPGPDRSRATPATWSAAAVPLPGLRGRGAEVVARRRARGRVDRGREPRSRRSDAPHQGEGRRGRARRQPRRSPSANRDDFDRAGVAVVNLMSAPGAGKTTLLERGAPRPRRRPRRGARGRRPGEHGRRPDRRASTSRSSSSTPTPASAASATSTPTWSARRSPTCRSTRSTCW